MVVRQFGVEMWGICTAHATEKFFSRSPLGALGNIAVGHFNAGSILR
jgi:hypothetical protein